MSAKAKQKRLLLSAHVHARRPGALLSCCGRRLSATLRWSRCPQLVTCQRCIDALGLDDPESRLLRRLFPE